jgi:hypothetical protein
MGDQSLLAGASGIGLALGLKEHFSIFRGQNAFIGILGVILVHRVLSFVIQWLKKVLCQTDKKWDLWYRDLQGGIENVDSILTSVIGTLFGSWIAHLLQNDFHVTPLFYLTAPLWLYILVVHITQRTKLIKE